MRESDERVLRALSAARGRYVELRPLLEFYEAVHRVQFEAKEGVGGDLRLPTAEECAVRQGRGEVVLSFDRLRLGTVRFVRLVREMTYVIMAHSPGWELPREPIEVGGLVELARRWYESGEHVVGGDGPALTLVGLAVAFALSAYLQEAAYQLWPWVDREGWQRGICPLCGGKPGFAVLTREGGQRELFCPRCHTQWAYKRTACPFCGNEDKILYFSSGEESPYRLYVCPGCRRYLKTADLRCMEGEAVLPVECLLTVALDLAAEREGYLYC